MYCRTCGSKMNDNAELCVKCGVRKNVGTEYCQVCGAKTTANMANCKKCGAKLKKAITTEQLKKTAISKASTGKKTLSTVLIILGAILIVLGITVGTGFCAILGGTFLGLGIRFRLGIKFTKK